MILKIGPEGSDAQKRTKHILGFLTEGPAYNVLKKNIAGGTRVKR